MESGEIFDEMTARLSCSLNYAAVVFIFRIIMRNFFIIIDSEHQDIRSAGFSFRCSLSELLLCTN